MAHCGAAELRLEELDCRIGAVGVWAEVRPVVDEKDVQLVGVRGRAHVEAVEVERGIAVDAGEMRWSNPLEAGGEGPGSAGRDDGETIGERAGGGVEEVGARDATFERVS